MRPFVAARQRALGPAATGLSLAWPELAVPTVWGVIGACWLRDSPVRSRAVLGESAALLGLQQGGVPQARLFALTGVEC